MDGQRNSKQEEDDEDEVGAGAAELGAGELVTDSETLSFKQENDQKM